MILVPHALIGLAPRPTTIPLNAERRLFLKRRWRGVAADGTEFGFDLESRLAHGDLIYQTEAADYIIFQEPEQVYEIGFHTPAQAALIGWKIGNLHLPVQILETVIRVVHDPAVQQLSEREGWMLAESSVIFNPLRVSAHAS
jgi:urease accessory protein